MFNRSKTEREIVELHNRLLERASRDETVEKHAKLLGLDKPKSKPTQRQASNSSAQYTNEQIAEAHKALFSKTKAAEKPAETTQKVVSSATPSNNTQKRAITAAEIDTILARIKKLTEPKKLSYREKEQLALQVAEEQPDNGLIQALAKDIKRRKATAETKTIGTKSLKKAYGATQPGRNEV